MKFGLHYQLPHAPHETTVERYRTSLDQAVYGETLGFESVWPVEQHFNAEFSLLPSPLLWLAALAERTRTIRLGIGIILLPLSHPVRVAEEVATLDTLSNGRVEFGIGRGVFPSHFAGFGVPQEESRERLLEGLELILRAWTQERFSYQGRFFQIKDLSVVPKPVQQPHPTVHVAANTAETYELMGRLGYSILSASQVNTFAKLRELIPLYRRAYRAAGHQGSDRETLTLLSPVFVGESAAQIRDTVEPSIMRFIQSVINAFPPIQDDGSDQSRLLQEAADRLRRTTFEQVCEAMAVYDTPEACVERLKRLEEEFGMGRMLCWFNTGGLIPHEQVKRSMQLFADKVMPHFV